MDFKYKCYQDLLLTFGRVDAIVECIELSVKMFIHEMEKHDDFEKFIIKKSKKHGIHVDTVDVEEFKLRASQLHIINVYQQFEGFLHDLLSESSFPLPPKDEDKSLFMNLLHELKKKNRNIPIKQIEVDIVEYYRYVRNSFMHPKIERGKYDSRAKKIRKKVSKNSDYKKFKAPNVYGSISFHDFILFTKVAKDIAGKLCVLISPSDAKIADLVKKTPGFKRLNRFKNNKNDISRYRKALVNFCISEYNMSNVSSAKVADEIIERY